MNEYRHNDQTVLFACCTYYTGESSSDVETRGDSNDIDRHAHDGKRVCTVCDKWFTSDEGLRYHELTAHTGAELHSGTECETRFSTQLELSQHMNLPQQRKCKCTECEKSFGSSQALHLHCMRVHSGPESNQLQMQKSVQIHSAVKCSECEKGFKNNRALQMHCMRVHSVPSSSQDLQMEKPAQIHLAVKCSECEKGFKSNLALRMHCMRVHSVPSSSQELQMQEGMEIHSAVKCTECEQNFESNLAL